MYLVVAKDDSFKRKYTYERVISNLKKRKTHRKSVRFPDFGYSDSFGLITQRAA